MSRDVRASNPSAFDDDTLSSPRPTREEVMEHCVDDAMEAVTEAAKAAPDNIEFLRRMLDVVSYRLGEARRADEGAGDEGA